MTPGQRVKPPMPVSPDLGPYRDRFSDELQHILDYWAVRIVDRDGDAFFGALDLAGAPVRDAPRSCVLNTRILWTFARAAARFDRAAYREVAERAYAVVLRDFRDPEHGGYYLMLDRDNRPLDTTKHTYAQAFALYALSAYAQWKGHEEVIALLRSEVEAFEDRTRAEGPGYVEAFDRAWRPITENRMADRNEPRSMNTHLHVLEAYTAVARVLGDASVRSRLARLIELHLDRILREDGHLGIFFDEAFEEAAYSREICSFGHDIEASWLLWEAGETVGDPDLLHRLRPACLRMVDAVVREGLDRGGGLFLESTRKGSHVRTNKHWWVQAEALVGLMNAYELSGDERYWRLLEESWAFVDRHVIDHERGEWYAKVNRLGTPYLEEPPDDPSPYYRNDWKADPWKGPYHNARAMMELVDRTAPKIHQTLPNH